VSELERLLVELGRTMREPEPPPAAQRAAGRLRREHLRPQRLRLRGAVAVALVAGVVAGVAAVSPARTSILRFFHLGGVTVERVEKLDLPPVSRRGPLAPGREVSLARARANASFPVLVPGRYPTPSHTLFYGSDPPGGQVSLVYGSLERPRLLVTEFRGTKVEGAFDKKAGRRTVVEQVRVGGEPGIWLGGAKHQFSFLDEDGMTRAYETRLAGNTLVWERGGLTLRLEGDLSKTAAIRLAESFVPAR
jgi:hypothetical protein